MNIQEFARILDKAAQDSKAVSQLSEEHSFSEEDAYNIQSASIDLRKERGEKLIGLKMGFTSRAKMQQMGVHDMIWGRLTNQMLLEEGGNLHLGNFIHPRAEPEIAYLVKKRIIRPLHMAEAGDFLDGVAPALEIIDSRYKDFKFSLEDVIADNCSSAGVILGPWKPFNPSLENVGITLEVNQRPVHIGSSAAILGNPLRSFIAATRLAAKYHQVIEEGSVILAGAATPAIYVESGQYVEVRIQNLGRAGINILP